MKVPLFLAVGQYIKNHTIFSTSSLPPILSWLPWEANFERGYTGSNPGENIRIAQNEFHNNISL
jgi:hypothetical protein